jgi:hypothetical protein
LKQEYEAKRLDDQQVDMAFDANKHLQGLFWQGEEFKELIFKEEIKDKNIVNGNS